MFATVAGNVILVRSDLRDKDVDLQSVPCGKYLPLKNWWRFPRTTIIARRLQKKFGERLKWSETPLTAELLEAAARFDLAHQMKDAETLAAIPGEVMTSWSHQRRGFWFAYHLEAALLEQGVGTGKSKEAVDLIRLKQFKKSIIVTTSGAVEDWPIHFAKHWPKDAPPVHVLALCDGATVVKQAEAVKAAYAAHEWLVVVCSWDTCWRFPLGQVEIKTGEGWARRNGVLFQLQFDAIFADELHNASSISSRRARFLIAISQQIHNRIGMTGTALKHRAEDLFAQFRFLDAGLFGYSFRDFCDRYCVYNRDSNEQLLSAVEQHPDGSEEKQKARALYEKLKAVPRFVKGYQRLNELHALFHKLTYHVGSDVLDLPEPIHVHRRVALSQKALRHYAEMEEELITYVADDQAIEAQNVLTKILRLQQITSGFLSDPVVDPDSGEIIDSIAIEIDDAKETALEELFSEIDPDEPVVVFCRFRHDLEVVKRVCKRAGRRYLEQSGERKQKREWMDATGGEVLGGQIKSACEAHDFTRAAYGIFYSLGHSLYQYEQAVGRLDRPGQRRQPTYVHLIADKTIDTKVYRSLRERKEVVDEVVSGIRRDRADGLRTGLFF